MQYYHPSVSSVVPDVGLLSNDNKKYTYKTFPKLNSDLYIKIDVPKMVYQSKFLISSDEVNPSIITISGVMMCLHLIRRIGPSIYIT
jgi:hypothetical protein